MVKLYFKLILFTSIATASCLQGMNKFYKNFVNKKNFSNFMRYSTKKPFFDKEALNRKLQNIKISSLQISLEMAKLGRDFKNLSNELAKHKIMRKTHGKKIKSFNKIKGQANILVKRAEPFLKHLPKEGRDIFYDLKNGLTNLKKQDLFKTREDK